MGLERLNCQVVFVRTTCVSEWPFQFHIEATTPPAYAGGSDKLQLVL
jgi:hypothetical protein